MISTIYKTLSSIFCKIIPPKTTIADLGGLEKDIEAIEALKSKIYLEGNVVVYLGDAHSRSWLVEKPEDYPLINIATIEESTCDSWEKESLSKGAAFIVTTNLSGFRQGLCTMEGVKLYLKEYYKIRAEILEAIFPKV